MTHRLVLNATPARACGFVPHTLTSYGGLIDEHSRFMEAIHYFSAPENEILHQDQKDVQSLVRNLISSAVTIRA